MHFIKSGLRWLVERNYTLSKALWKRQQRKVLRANRHEPIIIYQMGKVGSSTVQAALRDLELGGPMYHVHFLNPHRVNELEAQRRKYFGTERMEYLRRPWRNQFLYEEIQKQDRQWRLVTIVREPIARNVSTFFENLDVELKPDSSLYLVKSDYYNINIEVDLENVEPLIELFFDRLVHERPLRYFDDEMKTVFDIDIFASEFPRQKGYQILKGKNADLLVMRLDNLDQCAAQAFKDFMAIADFRLVHTNVGGEKIYAPLYKEFKSKICVPQDYIDQMYTSKFARHFYSQEEIQQLREKWAGDHQ